MTNRLALLLALGALLISPGPVACQVEIQALLGSAQSVPLPITISQDGQPDLHFTAHWATRPTRPTWYYAWRLGFWSGNRGWRLDHTHHKIYLTNPPSEVTALRVTNGFNILSVSRAFRQGHLTYSVGAGPVITFPISTVRGKKFTHDNGLGGYHLSGGSLLAMATREFPITGGLALSLDARATASYIRIPIVDGHAKIPNAAFHLHAGLGYTFGRRSR